MSISLPVVVLLRREHDHRDETLAALLTEQEVRDSVYPGSVYAVQARERYRKIDGK